MSIGAFPAALDDWLEEAFEEYFKETKGQREVWANVIDKIAAFGPRRVGPNLLIDTTSDGIFSKA